MSDKHSNLGELIMRTWSKNGAANAVLFGLMWVVVSAAALADVKDFEFQLVQSEMKKGDGAIVAVRLVNKKSGKPVPDAVIFAKRIDMAPDAMQEMTAPLEQLPSTEPGVYRFKTDLMMQIAVKSVDSTRKRRIWTRLCELMPEAPTLAANKGIP
jgi:YtkA-like